MSFVIYNDETTRLHHNPKRPTSQSWATEAAAKGARTRAKLDPDVWLISPADHFFSHIELSERRRNLMSGKWITVRVNTSASCDPSTETYWSM
jgi:hypothetical protein